MRTQSSTYLHMIQSPKSQAPAAMIFPEIHAAVADLEDTSTNHLVGVYNDFGSAHFWSHIRHDLRHLIQEQEKNKLELTYWAVFTDKQEFSQHQFEESLWNELLHLSSEEEKEYIWGNQSPNYGEQCSFSINIDGQNFLVRGRHPRAQHPGQRFSCPALIFSVIEEALISPFKYQTNAIGAQAWGFA